MTEVLTTPTSVVLTINGSRLAVGTRPELTEFEAALRGVALSDSPVVIQALEEDQVHLVSRLHDLGRRCGMPLRECREVADLEPLFEGVTGGAETSDGCLGTWALYGVHRWSEEDQDRLGEILEVLDLGRLHGRLRHERIPRIIMLSSPEQASQLRSRLARRISYFTLTAKSGELQEQ